VIMVAPEFGQRRGGASVAVVADAGFGATRVGASLVITPSADFRWPGPGFYGDRGRRPVLEAARGWSPVVGGKRVRLLSRCGAGSLGLGGSGAPVV
jgi:hypothetical protein